MIRVALLALLLAGCGYSIVSAMLARAECEEIYCKGYGVEDGPPIEECPHRDDVVVICIEDSLERSRATTGFWVSVVQAAIDVAL
jgi:hypothetical protein